MDAGRFAEFWLAMLVAMALGLLLAAIIVQWRTRQAERRHPPRGRFITVDGVRLHFVEKAGTGTPVVLLHGNGAMIADMEISGLIDAIGRRHRVVVFDRPGYGYSERPRRRVWTPEAQAQLLIRAFEQLNIERPIVFGHSWGTLVALALAIKHRDSIAGLVLASGYYFPTPRADTVLFAPPAIPVFGDLLRYTIAPLIGEALAPRLIARMFAPKPVTPEFARRFPVGLTLRPSQIRASSEETAIMVAAAAAMDESYRQIALPLAILAGAEDRIVKTEKQSVRLNQEVPGSSLQVLPEMGHMLHHFAAEEVVRAIDAVMSRTMRARAAAV
jgi:pimeloyl-ACP methyl ester carboxylesterase